MPPSQKKKGKCLMNNNIAIIRHATGMTQKELADKVGMSQGSLADYERGARNIENMTLKKAMNIARALKCPVEDLVGECKDEYKIADYIMTEAIDKPLKALEKAVAENDLDAIINNPLAR